MEQRIPSKPVSYKGIRFRSQLEARWAVFFDHMSIPWVYEPSYFDIPRGFGVTTPYLPDFFLPECSTWVEVKPHDDFLDMSLMKDASFHLPVRKVIKDMGPRLLILGKFEYADLSNPENSDGPGDLCWYGLGWENHGHKWHLRDDFRYGFSLYYCRKRPYWFFGGEGSLLSGNGSITSPVRTNSESRGGGCRLTYETCDSYMDAASFRST